MIGGLRNSVPSRLMPLLCAAGWIAIAAAVVLRATQSQGYYWGDDYVHLLMSKSVIADPRIVLDTWGRPIMTLAYFPAALAGDGAVRLTSLLLLFATAVACWRTAKVWGLPLAPAAGIFFLGQPLAATLGFAALPATVFSLLLAVALWLRATHRDIAAAVVVSLLPLARLEGILVVLLWALYLALERRWRLVPWLGVGLAAWAMLSANVFGDPLWLLRHNPYSLLTDSPNTQRAGWDYLFLIWAPTFGPLVGGIAIAALFRPREVDHLSGLLVVALALFFMAIWGLPALLAGSIPTGVYLVDMSVPLALCAQRSFVNIWQGRRASVWGVAVALLLAMVSALRWPDSGNLAQLAVVAAAAALALAHRDITGAARTVAAPLVLLLTAVVAVSMVKPLALADQPLLVNQLARTLTASRERVNIASDPAFAWFAWEMDPTLGNRFLSGPALRSAVERAAAGTRVLWDPVAGGPYVSEVDMRRWGYAEEWNKGGIVLWVRSMQITKDSAQ